MQFKMLGLVTIFISLFGKSHAVTNPKVFQEFPNKYFVETGSYIGDGIQFALDVHCFEVIHSIEVIQEHYDHCKERFSAYENVILWHGDSGTLMQQVLETIDGPTTFWLDGHVATYWGAGCAYIPEVELTPIMQELEAIKNHPIKTHTILIDDRRLFGTEFASISEEQVRNKILEINPNYRFEVRDCWIANDILVAYIPN